MFVSVDDIVESLKWRDTVFRFGLVASVALDAEGFEERLYGSVN
ncbi:MAG: hypothetical protein M2R45_04260 [Verrucomicrobia subdivision 3 bacterium]|nr:hypothetical protein [Limisphaerales bacterium]MCS1412613.1 hypothetical protein [Limisphaerales bacterium]